MMLVEFLLARILDDERLARMAFADHNGNGPDWSEPWSGAVDLGGDEHELLLCNDSGVSRHIENFDPARVLAECQAKLRIVGDLGGFFGLEEFPAGLIDHTLRLLALPYAAHDDYQDAWKP